MASSVVGVGSSTLNNMAAVQAAVPVGALSSRSVGVVVAVAGATTKTTTQADDPIQPTPIMRGQVVHRTREIKVKIKVKMKQ